MAGAAVSVVDVAKRRVVGIGSGNLNAEGNDVVDTTRAVSGRNILKNMAACRVQVFC